MEDYKCEKLISVYIIIKLIFIRIVYYFTLTSLDLAYVVHILAQFMQALLIDHWDATLRAIRYFKCSCVKEYFCMLILLSF